jgi:hypothetical protein
MFHLYREMEQMKQFQVFQLLHLEQMEQMKHPHAGYRQLAEATRP